MATPPGAPPAGTIVDLDGRVASEAAANTAAAADLKRAEDARADKEAREHAAKIARDAALARAQEAEREAALAQMERDAVDERIRAALERAARERAAAETPQDDDAGDAPAPTLPLTLATPLFSRPFSTTRLLRSSICTRRPLPCRISAPSCPSSST